MVRRKKVAKKKRVKKVTRKKAAKKKVAKKKTPTKDKVKPYSKNGYWRAVKRFMEAADLEDSAKSVKKTLRPRLGNYLKKHGEPQDPTDRPDDHMIERTGLRTRWQGSTRVKKDEEAIREWAKKHAPKLLRGIDWQLYDEMKASKKIPAKMVEKFESTSVSYTFLFWLLKDQECGKCGEQIHKRDRFCKNCGEPVKAT